MLKKLSIKNPSIKTYLGDAFCFSIINDKAFTSGWVYDKYINLQYCMNDNHMKYADYDYYDFCPNEGVFIKSFIYAPYINNNPNCLINYIKELIEDEFYYFGIWNEARIPGADGYNTHDGIYPHGCFIYGYDDEKRIFFTEGYKKNNIWGKFEVLYNTFVESIRVGDICKDYYTFNGYKVNIEYEWKFDIKRMKNNLVNYLKADTYIENMNSYFGIEGCYKLFDYVEKQCVSLKHLHIPSIYNIFEHKTIMVKRIKFLSDNNYITNIELVNKFIEVCDTFRFILYKSLKYNSNKNNQVGNSLKNAAYESLNKEKDAIVLLLKELNY